MAPTTISFTGWLALRQNHRSYGPGAMRLTSKKPGLKAGEIAVQLSLSVPAALFTKPTLKLVAEIPDDSTIAAEIPAHVQTNIAELVREQTGLLLEISVEDDE